ncbi:RraA family protein [Anaerosphaera multitolerans]|uniref:Putative 4-hydroxy-4-methyl-2-oxoglutarate aldolase n=1 Tax=Anaerosphaera multitolerans TaxID=2487351 RepID=A0A437S4H1_9FIRM|nr:RraA family protein [Anaerosphaera multitolerans]RVU53894.1 RraA family protein [Anaerosphaera multitolerans]
MKKKENLKISKEVIDNLRNIDITSLSDVCVSKVSMNHLIKPKINTHKIVGTAVTLKLPKGDSLTVQKALNIAKAGDVLVVDSGGSVENAVWGDLRSLKAKKKGLEGVVIDGAIRDIVGCREIGFPIFSKYLVCASSTKIGGGEINIPITCGDILVHPGDVIIGDENGVIVLPKSNIHSIIEKALKREQEIQLEKEKILNEV